MSAVADALHEALVQHEEMVSHYDDQIARVRSDFEIYKKELDRLIGQREYHVQCVSELEAEIG